MSIIFSKGCEYGLQAVLYISTLERDRRILIKEVAEKLQIPVHFLAKILQQLSQKGILKSYKGSKGGFVLGRSPEEIRLIDIVNALDGMSIFTECILGFPGCSTEHPCPVHDKWGKIRTEAYEMLADETIADVKEKSKSKIASLGMDS